LTTSAFSLSSGITLGVGLDEAKKVVFHAAGREEEEEEVQK